MKYIALFLDQTQVFFNRQNQRIGTAFFIIVNATLVVGLTCLFVTVLRHPAKPVENAPQAPIEVVDNRIQDIKDLANANDFKPSERIVKAILVASDTYKIDALELTAIGIVETGLGKYAKTRKNTNGTKDRGLFQINTVNESKCVEYNLDIPEGSALCAAKLLSTIKSRRTDYLGVYHSKTKTKKAKYIAKLSQVLALVDKQGDL